MARQINAATMVANWTKGIQGAGQKWTAGIDNPRQEPNANPAAATTNWEAGVAAGAPAYTAALSNPQFLQLWRAGAKAKVASFTGSGQARAQNYAKSAEALAPMIAQALSSLGPKGPRGTNTARSTAFQTAMHALRGRAKGRI